MSNVSNSDTETVDLSDLLLPLRRGIRVLVFVPLVAGVLVGAFGLLRAREFQATTVLASSSGGRSLGGLGSLVGAAAMLGASGSLSQGLQLTPEIIVAMLESRRVRHAVGRVPIGPDGRPLADALTGEPVPITLVPRVLSRFVGASVSRETGLVTLQVRHSDSALARILASSMLEELRRAYVEASQQQASDQRAAQDRRVDSAYRRLRHSEEGLMSFARRNRIVSEFSVESVERERLVRDVDIARQVYLQAVTDRETAVARELQELPAVVAIDPVSSVLPYAPRFLALKVAVALFGAFMLVATGLLIRESWRPREA